MNAGHISLIQKLKNLFVSTNGIIIEQQVIIPDVSFWQDDNSTPQGIDFLQMKDNGAKGVIIRAGQNTWVDPDFVTGWRNAKLAGLARGLYWFYDSRKDPISQANLFYQQAKNDPPEMEWVVDYEESYGGNYGGWQNLKVFLEHLRGLGIPVSKIAIYSGYYYWREHSPQSNPLNLSYFKQFPLWLPWYTTDPARVLIPAPWTNLDLLAWQFTSSGNGSAYGVESNAIDLNYWNMTPQEFDAKYLGATEPPPTGEPMWYQGTVKGNVLLRVLSSAGETPHAYYVRPDGVRVDYLQAGQIVIAQQKYNQWLKVYKIDGNVVSFTDVNGNLTEAWVSSGSTGQYITIVEIPPENPVPEPSPEAIIVINDHIEVTVNGVVYWGDSQTLLVKKP